MRSKAGKVECTTLLIQRSQLGECPICSCKHDAFVPVRVEVKQKKIFFVYNLLLDGSRADNWKNLLR